MTYKPSDSHALSPWRLIRRTVGFYRRGHACLALALAACTAVIIGALAVGDSMRHTLRTIAVQRTGGFDYALFTGDRFVREALAGETDAAAALMVAGAAVRGDGSRRVNAVRVLGVSDTLAMEAHANLLRAMGPDEGALNVHLARKLGAGLGDEVVVRVPAAGAGGEMALTGAKSELRAFRFRVRTIVGDDRMGRFALENTQLPPLNAYLPLATLQAGLETSGRINLLLARAQGHTREEMDARLARAWHLSDMGLDFRALPEKGLAELRSADIFLGDEVARAALRASSSAFGVLTYLVNGIAAGGRETPYSFVAGVPEVPGLGALRPDEVAITDWLANDLGVTNGAEVALRYFVLGPLRALTETGAVFRVAGVVPLTACADRTLMPEIPGISESGNCRDWESGVTIDLGRIRPADEAYWETWRGAPKAFVALASAQALWSNRWGSLTAVRYPVAGGEASEAEAGVRRALGGLSRPSFRSLREEAARSWSHAMDFGQLFLGLSLFLVVSTILMMALLFKLAVEERMDQIGLMLAVGIGLNRVRAWFMAENLLMAVPGGLLGLAAGSLYAGALLRWFERHWQPAGSLQLRFHVDPGSWAIAFGAAAVLALAAGWLAPRRLGRLPIRALLDRHGPDAIGMPGGHLWQYGAAAALAVAGASAWQGGHAEGNAKVEYFFLTGFSLLAAGVGTLRGFMQRRGARVTDLLLNRAGLARRNADRHPGRSVLIAGMVACAVFLLVVVELFQPHTVDPRRRGSGTGGFALMMETAAPITADLNSAAGRKAYGLPAGVMEGVGVTTIRVRPGDDAGCRNLSRAQEPRLAGVDPGGFAQRGAFTFMRALPDRKGSGSELSWRLLDRDCGPDVVPAVTDETTLTWGLGRTLGDELTYVDEFGRPFRVRLAGLLKDTVLQGSVLIAERHLRTRYPSLAGTTLFLVDAPEGREAAVAAALADRLQDQGAEVTSCTERLAELGSVTAMYLKLFQTLGGLGLLLGVGVVALAVLRNAVERRGELGLLRAVGFTRAQVAGMLVAEQAWLVGAGLAVGLAAALAAVAPALDGRDPAAVLRPGLAGLLVLVAAGGTAASLLAARAATRAAPLEALREE